MIISKVIQINKYQNGYLKLNSNSDRKTKFLVFFLKLLELYPHDLSIVSIKYA